MASLLDSILSHYLPAAFRFGSRLRAYLLGLVAKWHPYGATPTLNALQRGIRGAAPTMAEQLKQTFLGSWVGSAYGVAKDAYLDDEDIIKLPPPPKILLASGMPSPKGGYLYHERGLDWLENQRVIPSGMARNLDFAAGKSAEVIAHATTEETAQRLSGALAKALREGGSIRNFKAAVGEEFDSSPLNDSQLETLYRTNGGRVYSAGQQAVLSHPLVGSEFPYLLYSATHDSRVEHSHLAMEHLGQNASAVYRSNDPVIRKFYPPWRWNCRCHVIPLNIADAARHGSEEAQRWLETGVAPAAPNYVPNPPFSLPKGWVPVSAWNFPSPVV